MNARQLEIFHAVMRSGTITGAATFLGISQPAVSKAMHAIERRLGFKLLRPVKGRLYPTPEAERLLPDADRIMSELSAFERLTGEVRTGGTGLVRVVASSSCATALLPMATTSFLKANPSIRISSHLLPAREAAEAVAAGEADFGLTLSPVQLPGLNVRTLGSAEMVLIAPHGHPVLARDVVTPLDLAKCPLISFGRETHFGQLLDQAFEQAGARRQIDLQVTMSIVAAGYVQRGIGVALVDSFTLHAGFAGLSWRPFNPAIMLPVTLMSPGSHLLSRHANVLVGSIEKVLRDWTRSLSTERSRAVGKTGQSRRGAPPR
jgi:DNA-binding transcriptional LysR family regulator